jgi:triacylglycerol lipase
MRDTPVILVHGFKDDAQKMARLAARLAQAGRQAHCVTVAPALGQVGIDALASQLAQFVAAKLPEGVRFDLVGFSMGGLTSRYYLQRLGGASRVRRFITLSTPHRGSLLAWFVNNPGCRQMRPGSEFLKDLANDAHLLKGLGFTSFWTPWDLMILPASSSVIPDADCRKIHCLFHPWMVSQRNCLEAVVERLNEM